MGREPAPIRSKRFLAREPAWVAAFFFISVLATIDDSIAEPADPGNYQVVAGGAIDIPAGSVVEGSTRYGGIQPDYFIDTGGGAFSELFEYAAGLKTSEPVFWEKVRLIGKYTSRSVLREKDYGNVKYRNELAIYRDRGADIPLSRYVDIGAGVCRENALIYQQALKIAGIESYHVYVNVRQGVGKFAKAEDHAAVIVPFEGRYWVVDSYNPNFNGYLLSDLLEGKAPRANRMAPFAEKFPDKRRILAINAYPRVWIPFSSGPVRRLGFDDLRVAPRKSAEKCLRLFRSVANSI